MSKPVFRLYDTLSRQVKELKTLEPEHLRFYSCGPTVYSYAHIGNFRTFLTADLIIRTAEALGWKVSYVTNITDVGHLTQDDVADMAGEDRMAKALAREGQRFASVWDLAEHYIQALKGDWSRLNLKEPLTRPRATQYMAEQIKMIEALIEKNHAYETPTGVYYDVRSFPEYGKLSGNVNQEQLMVGVRDVVTDDNKRHTADFALWKKDPKHLMQWFSPWNWGFPGWHIECSAMARELLGDTLDLHAGGEDLRFPHHECEIAQSEGLTGKPFSNHWVHTAFLQVEGEKMSKSIGNLFTVEELVDERGADALAVRYALISGVYGKPLNFTMQTLEDANKNVERFRTSGTHIEKALKENRPGEDAIGPDLRDLYDATLAAMCDNLNTAVALAKALEGTRVILREGDTMSAASATSGKEFLDRVNGLLGVVRYDNGYDEEPCGDYKATHVDEALVNAKVEERNAAKKAKDFTKADAVREELAGMGIELRDTPEGTTWHVKPRF
ncbi:MAG: cysteinyl-tRNA synthetase [Fimbriimonadaceae bacterium]|jgi:cysteinyl-tRNA synthetase|nr:cysteinyl-tRNA synthetase [Fimbriimonadaceae bacterium]